jgi:hypothetical protein
MNWWSILKVIRPLDDPQVAETERQRQAKFGGQEQFGIEQPITQRKPPVEIPQYQGVENPPLTFPYQDQEEFQQMGSQVYPENKEDK